MKGRPGSANRGACALFPGSFLEGRRGLVGKCGLAVLSLRTVSSFAQTHLGLGLITPTPTPTLLHTACRNPLPSWGPPHQNYISNGSCNQTPFVSVNS